MSIWVTYLFLFAGLVAGAVLGAAVVSWGVYALVNDRRMELSYFYSRKVAGRNGSNDGEASDKFPNRLPCRGCPFKCFADID